MLDIYVCGLKLTNCNRILVKKRTFKNQNANNYKPTNKNIMIQMRHETQSSQSPGHVLLSCNDGPGATLLCRKL